jgi:hypothetical protein
MGWLAAAAQSRRWTSLLLLLLLLRSVVSTGSEATPFQQGDVCSMSRGHRTHPASTSTVKQLYGIAQSLCYVVQCSEPSVILDGWGKRTTGLRDNPD